MNPGGRVANALPPTLSGVFTGCTLRVWSRHVERNEAGNEQVQNVKFKKAILSEDGHITTFLAGERLSDPANVRVPTAVAAAATELLEVCERLHKLSGENGVPLNLSALAEFQNEVFRLTAKVISKAKGTL